MSERIEWTDLGPVEVIPAGEVKMLADDCSAMSFGPVVTFELVDVVTTPLFHKLMAESRTISFANIQWPQFTFTPKPEPSPDAKPAVAGLMRVGGKARGFGWCDE